MVIFIFLRTRLTLIDICCYSLYSTFKRYLFNLYTIIFALLVFFVIYLYMYYNISLHVHNTQCCYNIIFKALFSRNTNCVYLNLTVVYLYIIIKGLNNTIVKVALQSRLYFNTCIYIHI